MAVNIKETNGQYTVKVIFGDKGDPGKAAPILRIQYSSDEVSWHDTYQDGDTTQRQSTDGGVTWSDAIPLGGVASIPADVLRESGIIDDLTSILATRPLSANQGRVLKVLIDNINTILTSDDTTLDEIQEIVNYIKQNKQILDTLGISNIAGLADALSALTTDVGTAQSRADSAHSLATQADGKAQTHIDNNTPHVSSTDRTNWNSKADGNHNHQLSDISDAGTIAGYDALIYTEIEWNALTPAQQETQKNLPNTIIFVEGELLSPIVYPDTREVTGPFTLDAADAEGYIRYTSASNFNVVIPNSLPLESVVTFRQGNAAGELTPVADTGVTLNGAAKTIGPNTTFAIKKIADNVFDVIGGSSSGAGTESDPIFSASPASGITAQNITDWENKAAPDHTHAGTYEPFNENIQQHISATTGNPHNVTATDVGLGNVNNTSDTDKPVSTAQQAALDAKEDKPIAPRIETTAVTLTAADANRYIIYDGVSNINITVPNSIPVNTDILFWQNNTGIYSLVPDVGVILLGNLISSGQHTCLGLKKIADNLFHVIGGIA